MKYATTLMALGLALGVVSEPIAKRTLADVLSVFDAIGTAGDALVAAVNGYVAGDDASDVLEPCNAFVAAIDNGAGTIGALDVFGDSDQRAIPRNVISLGREYQAPLAALTSGKDTFVSEGFAWDVKVCIGQVSESSSALLDAITHVAPSQENTIRNLLWPSNIVAHIQAAADAYTDVTEPEEPTTTSTTAGPTETETPSPTDTVGEPTGTATEPTGTATPTAPTGTVTEPTGTASEPTGTGTSGPTATDGPDEPEETVTVTVTVTDCPQTSIPGVPSPTGGNPPGQSPPPSGEEPPSFDGAGSQIKMSAVGVLAALAAVLAF
ncbi:hypothetical protein VTO42DRAFT_4291 [Malbranchea cinnamomea]